MAQNQVKVLLVDDDEDDYIITRDLLDDILHTDFKLDWISSFSEALLAVEKNEHDVYLFDYRLGQHSGLELLREVILVGCRKPIILLTGQADREVDLEAMKAGAADFLSKGQLNAPLLERSIRYSIERSNTEQKLAYMAQYDPLTGLPNRNLFHDRLRHSITLAAREACLVGLLFLDLDRFKIINDTLGHNAGDLLLKGVSDRLSKCVRDCDTVARMGGDEFVVILSALTDTKSASIIAQRIVDAIRPAFILEGGEVFTAASVGIAFYPFDSEDAESLIKSADAAMYKSKADGGNSYRFYSKAVSDQVEKQMYMESSLHRALEKDEFILYYQPQYSLTDQKIVGVEALLRWAPEGQDLVPPDQFLPLLNETGMINSIGEWVLRTACRQLRQWSENGFPDLRMAVNFSTRQLKKLDLADMIARVIAETSVKSENLELELTEDTLMNHFQEHNQMIERIRDIGVTISLDDFGTGYSSLSSLKSYPIDRLKIDQTFVGNIRKGSDDSAICKAIISLAHSLEMKVTAEGVESKEQLAFLQEYGCDEGQGNYFSPAVDAGAMSEILRRKN
ncbi:MAG: EAL domain-containing protein [Proteobacteria bacterium]|nr:EAL domain-containing protein [Pseudomonadota bacterium]MBU1715958.1 EAL domain-containing protein [Pseudomonadota bacterium]